ALERRVQQLEAIARIGRSVTASLDLDDVLSEVVSAAVQLANAEEGSLLLKGPDSDELFMRAARNFDDEFVRTFRLPSEDSLAGQVLKTGEPYLLGQDAPHKIKTTYLVRSLLYVPLKVRGETIGVLGIDNRQLDRHFTKDDIAPLQALADYAAIAIENARLFEYTEDERRKLDTILTKTADAVIVTDPGNQIILMNDAARRAFGIDGRDVTGLPLQQVVPNEELHELFVSTAHEQQYQRAEVKLEDGRVLNAHLTVVEGVGQAAIMQDITHLKELDRIKSEFVSTVSHDLRSPLTAILGYVDLITRSGPVTELQAEFIDRVKFSVGSITALITDLLDLGRIEQGFDTRKELVDLPLVSRYAIESLRGRAHAKGQTVEVNLPESADPVLGNPTRLRQLVANLVDNAIKYTPEGGRIAVNMEQTGNQTIITVTDTGIGIDPAEQSQVFDKFFRSEHVVSREDTTGTGLGLSIVKSIVENHNGRIWLESKVGEGTTFTVVLPTATQPD
ncbi:MAG: ATP-binding protein, partial [Anaerolineales bacterium]